MANLRFTSGKSVSELREMDLNSICALRFNEAEIAKAYEKVYTMFRESLNCSDPRRAPTGSRGLAWVKHKAWFSSEENKHLEVAAPPRYIASLMRFRLGCCMDLRVYDHSIPNRQDRFCEACREISRSTLSGGKKMIEDEYHLIFECVRFNRLRNSLRWGSLFGPSINGNMKVFMNQTDQGKVAHLIHMLLEIRKDPLITNWNLDMFESSSTGSEF